jgi:hypothetical protein
VSECERQDKGEAPYLNYQMDIASDFMAPLAFDLDQGHAPGARTANGHLREAVETSQRLGGRGSFVRMTRVIRELA